MQIRTRLTLQFLFIGAMIMILASLSIYYFSSKYREQAFSDRLKTKAKLISDLLLQSKFIGAERLEQLEKRNPLKLHNEKIIILTSLDDTLYTTDYNNEILIRYDILQNIRSGRQLFYRQGEYEVLGSLNHLGSDNRFVVIAAAVDKEGLRHLMQLRFILIVVCLISVFIFIISGWIYSGQALKPISGVINQVNDISITSLNMRVSEGNGHDEIGMLARTFNKMLERLEKSFAMQKDFIANASHELRTPLTSINGQLDVLLMKDRTNDEYKEAVSSVLDDTRSLIDNSNRLLLIARTSSEGPVNVSTHLRIDEVIWQARDEVLRFNKGYHVHISLDDSLSDPNDMQVVGDESLLKVAFMNLIENACKYSNDHSVKVNLLKSDEQIALLFIDKGIGIPDEDIKKIFEPFYRARNAKSIIGSGIGLPLVKQIISNHNGIIEVSSTVGKGTQFTVFLPVSN